MTTVDTPMKPILFSGPMVRAILDGQKTQTRRLCKQAVDHGETAHAVCPARESGYIAWFSQQPSPAEEIAAFTKQQYQHGFKSPYSPGDMLWVRETWQPNPEAGSSFDGAKIPSDAVCYRADLSVEDARESGTWKPSIFMPKLAARLFLRVTDVRVQRLQEISEADVVAEGVAMTDEYLEYIEWVANVAGGVPHTTVSPREFFGDLWDRLYKKRAPWESNPWVWVYTFERVEKPA